MTHTITIKTDNAANFELIRELAQKLGLPTAEKHEEGNKSNPAIEFSRIQQDYPPRQIPADVDIHSIIEEINQ